MHWMFRPNREFLNDLQATLIDTRLANNRLDVFGRLTNSGTHTWAHISVEAEVYDQGDKFLEEGSTHLWVTLPPGGEENFRLALDKPNSNIREEATKIVLKVTDARENRF
jgi:hypothetical protein